MIDINDRFNVRNIIKYYNVIHIKDNIYEVEGKGNFFRLVTLKTLHPNDREFCSYDIAETLDKKYVLDGYHSYVELFLNTTSAYNIGSNNNKLLSDIDLTKN